MKWLAVNSKSLDWWEVLCNQYQAPVFAFPFYWKALAENAIFLVNDREDGGILIPLITKAGIQQVYTPNFYRYSSWIGNDQDNENWQQLITEKFKVGYLHIAIDATTRCFQHIPFQEDWEMNSQAKRMVKKAKDLEIVKADDFKAVFSFVKNELSEKISSIADSDWERLFQMLQLTKKTGHLEVLELVFQGQLVGGLLLLHTEQRTLYLKGTVTPEAKTKGGMYLLMEQAIRTAREQQRSFDFGGSNAEGVKQFNHNLGGKDAFYAVMQWNKAPLWWRFARSLKKRLKK